MELPGRPTEEVYEAIVTEAGLLKDIEAIDTLNLCWIGSRTAKSVLVYFCGGGFVTYAWPTHVQMNVNSYKAMKANGQDISIVIPAYGVCPGSPYPTQHRQMVATIQHLLKTRSPESINFAGDSAGGILALSLLLHYTHPQPSVPAYSLPIDSRFGEAFLISPGAPVITQTPSMLQDPVKDCINPEMGKEWWNIIISTSEKGIEMPNQWISPSSAPAEWWKGMPIGKITIVLGDDEILRDDIMTFAEKLQKHHDKEVSINKFANEFHDQCLIDMMQGITEDKESSKMFKKWLTEL